MTRNDLVEALAIRRNLPRRTAEEVVATIFDAMHDSLVKGGRIELRGFGSFQVRHYDGYTGRNPRTGKTIAVAPKRLPFFKPGKKLKAVVDTLDGEE